MFPENLIDDVIFRDNEDRVSFCIKSLYRKDLLSLLAFLESKGWYIGQAMCGWEHSSYLSLDRVALTVHETWYSEYKSVTRRVKPVLIEAFNKPRIEVTQSFIDSRLTDTLLENTIENVRLTTAVKNYYTDRYYWGTNLRKLDVGTLEFLYSLIPLGAVRVVESRNTLR
jgi:hypothetical protein